MYRMTRRNTLSYNLTTARLIVRSWVAKPCGHSSPGEYADKLGCLCDKIMAASNSRMSQVRFRREALAQRNSPNGFDCNMSQEFDLFRSVTIDIGENKHASGVGMSQSRRLRLQTADDAFGDNVNSIVCRLADL